MTILCLASYEKGHEFLRECKRQGWNVVLLTSESIRQEARFPTESMDEIFYMADDHHRWDLTHTLNAVAYLARTRSFDRIVPLDDFDVEVAAMLREQLRVPGMGETTAHYFRDKLAMRMRAADAGIHERIDEGSRPEYMVARVDGLAVPIEPPVRRDFLVEGDEVGSA